MEDISTINRNIINNAYNRALELFNKAKELRYFDKKNYEENIKDLNISFVNNEELNNKFALYNIENNNICINKDMLSSEILDENQVCLLLLNELVCMSSSNRKKGKVGYIHDAFPNTYNKGCNEYITFKLFYGDKFNDAIDKGLCSNDTIAVKSLVDLLGEDKIFNGFFRANPRESVDCFTPKELDRWIDTIMEMSKEYQNEKNDTITFEEESLSL